MVMVKMCARCALDESIPGIKFDAEGVCNYCHLHDRLEKEYPLNEDGKQRVNSIVEKIRREGSKNKYDCIVGLSGGCDSTYALYSVKKLGLRPLAVNFDDGWGSDIAGNNMKKAVEKLKVDFKQIKADPEVMNDWYRAFLRASVPEPDLPCDIGYLSSLYQAADEEKTKYIIVGNTFRTEGMLPLSWHYLDGRYFEGVIKRFADVKDSGNVQYSGLKEKKGFNRCDLLSVFHFMFMKRIKVIQLLVHIGYNRVEAARILSKELDWEEPGEKHFDNLHQALVSYVVRRKFGHDWRKIRLSAQVRSGEFSRQIALDELQKEPAIEEGKHIEFCLKKLGLSGRELEAIMKEKPKYFFHNPSYYPLIKLMKFPIKLFCKLHLLQDTLYEKYFEMV